MKTKLQARFGCNTVGDLLDRLTQISKDGDLSGALDSPITGPDAATFAGFRVIELTLTDGSKVLNFELYE